MEHKIIIAVDGYSSCGKSTIARQLARKLGYKYIDTGAMYRAVTLYFINHNIDTSPGNEASLPLENIHIDFHYDPEKRRQATFLNGIDVEDRIRQWDVTRKVSEVSALKSVRTKLVKLQQAFGRDKGVVMDGRDIGTNVFPHAELKIFMTSTPKVRALRRYQELQADGSSVTFNEVFNNLKERDHLDSTRKENPLIKAPDARMLDNTSLSPEEQLNKALKWAKEVLEVGKSKAAF